MQETQSCRSCLSAGMAQTGSPVRSASVRLVHSKETRMRVNHESGMQRPEAHAYNEFSRCFAPYRRKKIVPSADMELRAGAVRRRAGPAARAVGTFQYRQTPTLHRHGTIPAPKIVCHLPTIGDSYACRRKFARAAEIGRLLRQSLPITGGSRRASRREPFDPRIDVTETDRRWRRGP